MQEYGNIRTQTSHRDSDFRENTSWRLSLCRQDRMGMAIGFYQCAQLFESSPSIREEPAHLYFRSLFLGKEGTLRRACHREVGRKVGTTLTALYLPGDNTAYAAHVGDSRLYLYRNNTLSQITKDHSYVADLLAQGKITSSEAFNHPKKNMLLQALGVEEEIRTDIFHFALEKGDILLLCSDGLSDMLRDLEIANILEASDFENAATALLEQSLDNGGKDNISLIMIAVEEDA